MSPTLSASPDATPPPLHAVRPLGELAADLHRLAAFITVEDLPEGDVTFLRGTGVVVDLTRSDPHPRGSVAQWARALDTTVTTRDHDAGRVEFDAVGYAPDGTWVHVTARQVTR